MKSRNFRYQFNTLPEFLEYYLLKYNYGNQSYFINRSSMKKNMFTWQLCETYLLDQTKEHELVDYNTAILEILMICKRCLGFGLSKSIITYKIDALCSKFGDFEVIELNKVKKITLRGK